MATVLSCGACGYPITFRDIAPDKMGETEKEITCPRCGAMYAILVRMTKVPEVVSSISSIGISIVPKV